MRRIFVFIAVSFVFYSCGTQTQLYNWRGYDDAVYNYTKTADENSEERLMAVYVRLIDNSGGSRKVPPPGVCADYGYLLIKKGKIEEGKTLLLRETVLYPESKVFVDRILARLEK